MKWILTYTMPDDKLPLHMKEDIPYADTFKKKSDVGGEKVNIKIKN